MNYEKMGIVVTVIILCSMLSVAVISSSDIDIGTSDVRLPHINAGTNTNIPQQDGFYEYCYRMGLDC